jgi:hypothetical protein
MSGFWMEGKCHHCRKKTELRFRCPSCDERFCWNCGQPEPRRDYGLPGAPGPPIACGDCGQSYPAEMGQFFPLECPACRVAVCSECMRQRCACCLSRMDTNEAAFECPTCKQDSNAARWCKNCVTGLEGKLDCCLRCAHFVYLGNKHGFMEVGNKRWLRQAEAALDHAWNRKKILAFPADHPSKEAP